MSSVARRALLGFVQFQVALAGSLFLPAGTWNYGAAWAYWLLFGTVMLATTLYFLRHDPGFVERRLSVGPGAEKRKSQQYIQAIAGVLTRAMYVVAALDYRFG
ncbi:MAG TPA: hypothetical protein VGG64_05795, partial [Pirellulales bacterium]